MTHNVLENKSLIYIYKWKLKSSASLNPFSELKEFCMSYFHAKI
jgi:hypothetical protein